MAKSNEAVKAKEIQCEEAPFPEARWKHGVIEERQIIHSERRVAIPIIETGYTYENAQLLRQAVSVQQIQVGYLNLKMMRQATTSQLVARHDGGNPVEQEPEELLSTVMSPVGGARPSRTRNPPKWMQDYIMDF